MKKYLVWGLGLLVVLASSVSFADYNVLNKTTYFQNATNGARVDASGNAQVVEQYPASSFFIFKPNWLNTVLQHRCAGGPPPSPAVMQDSTSAEDVRGANNLALMIYPTFKDSTGASLIALQVRWHFTSGAVDSATSFIEQATRTFYASSGGTARDSVGSLLYASAGSTYGTNKYGGDADSVATPDEQVLVLTNVAGQNRGRLVRLTPPNAPNGSSAGPFLSIRVRHLNTTRMSTGAFLGDGTSGFEQPVRLNIALVGWR